MGQAKRRGTYEERKALAIACDRQIGKTNSRYLIKEMRDGGIVDRFNQLQRSPYSPARLSNGAYPYYPPGKAVSC